jgi:hypothetical protein
MARDCRAAASAAILSAFAATRQPLQFADFEIQRVKGAPLERITDRFGHEFLSLSDRLFECQAAGKTSRDRRRIRAAGAMSCDAANERG